MRRHEEGTVLLSTLLVLSLMSAVALALLATLQSSITHAGTVNARAQVALYAQGAQEFSQAQIQQLAGMESTQLNQFLSQAEPYVLPFDNGSISLRVSDGTQCFRLSALSDSTGQGQDSERMRFEALLVLLGVDQGQASRIAAAALDWVDRDSQLSPGGAEDGTYLSRALPHRTANVPMQSVTELRAVEGMTEDLFQQLLPYLCIGETGTPTQFNIDGAQEIDAPVLAALLGGEPEAEAIARELIGARPDGGYGSTENLLLAPALDGFEHPAFRAEDIVFEPQRIVIEAIIAYGDVEQAQLLAFEGLDSQRPLLAYRAWGFDEFPSLARLRLSETTSEGAESLDR